ncbi:hypothetical protein YYC_05805 [Plasmodium yoelii 17X]|uniref:Fam-a protein n=1 Tax=Plasmodium yoelii 17X TaxID=1323249 RepID=V7P9Z5_PLAYE|nr:hypothetical protein YYC_05805 [Plasmodium yoelii 17X]
MSKGYIKIIFSLLISSTYMNNKALASGDNSDIKDLRGFPQSPNTPNLGNDYPEGTNEQGPFDLCMDPGETKTAEKLMDEAKQLLQHHAVSTNDYKLHHKHDEDSIQYSKKHGNTIIYKFNHKIKYPDKYNDIIDMLWNPNVKYADDKNIKEKVVCEYSPNLMMIQHRYKNDYIFLHGYYYALAKKIKVSDDTTIIVYTSSDIDDHNSVDKKKYTNTIVESANLFKPKIYSEKDIRNGELTKMFVNLSGYIIQKKKDYVDITYLDSININKPMFEELLIGIVHSSQILNILRLTTIIAMK